MKKLFSLYAAGTLGALICKSLIWASSYFGIYHFYGSVLAPAGLSGGWYASLVWGGLWAFALLIPGLTIIPWLSGGFLLSLFPDVAQLLYFYPQAGGGYFGLTWGWKVPLTVIVLNFIWAWTTVIFSRR